MGKHRWRQLTPEQQAQFDAWSAAVDAATWDCPHGVKAGSLARPQPYYGPRCAICRHAGYTAWRRMDQLGRIPEAWL